MGAVGERFLHFILFYVPEESRVKVAWCFRWVWGVLEYGILLWIIPFIQSFNNDCSKNIADVMVLCIRLLVVHVTPWCVAVYAFQWCATTYWDKVGHRLMEFDVFMYTAIFALACCKTRSRRILLSTKKVTKLRMLK